MHDGRREERRCGYISIACMNVKTEARDADIKGAHTVGVMVDYLLIWDILSDFSLQPDVEDSHIWRFSLDGQYSAKTAYKGFFVGSTSFEPYERIWKTWAPPKCRFFVWLVTHNRCWTADRLARRGLPHPEQCPLCDQDAETIDHLLVQCVFAREFWFRFFTRFGLQGFYPQSTETSFHSWWERVSKAVSDLVKKGINSLIILGAWTLWTHRNRCVFDGAAPNVTGALAVAEDDRRSWSLAGARGLSLLDALAPAG